jgi:hypothetical protein
MGTCVYKLKFTKSSFDLNDDYEKLAEYEKERISELDAETYFDYDDDGDCYVCYVITSPTEIKGYLNILSKNMITCQCDDLSEKVLKHQIDLAIELKYLVSATNQIKYTFFVEDVDEWIYNNLDIDTVLDRISEVGSVDSLTKIEKEFLETYH